MIAILFIYLFIFLLFMVQFCLSVEWFLIFIVLKCCLDNTGDFPVLLPLGDRMCLGAGYLLWSISYLLAFVGVG